MSAVALEIHDAGILSAGGSLRVGGSGASGRSPEPGFALVEGGRVITGLAARSRSRLEPRAIQHRFWDELSVAPLGTAVRDELSAADLAYRHLEAVWNALDDRQEVESVILAVPGTFSEAQLGLLLGIARACGMPVRGLVDSALAAALGTPALGTPALGRPPGQRLLHLDLQLHRTVVTELERGREALVRRGVESSPRVGLVALHDAWARGLAKLFVRRTRFDPFHDAATEQNLYDQLPGWLSKLERDGQATLQLGRNEAHAIELERDEVPASADALYETITELVRRQLASAGGGGATTLLVSHRAAELPGLGARLAELDVSDLVTLPSGEAAARALAARSAIEHDGEALPFVLRLPLGSVIGDAVEPRLLRVES